MTLRISTRRRLNEMHWSVVIQVYLAPNVLCEVSTSTEETTKQLWKRLEGFYQDRLVTTKLLLQRRLHIFKIESSILLQDHEASLANTGGENQCTDQNLLWRRRMRTAEVVTIRDTFEIVLCQGPKKKQVHPLLSSSWFWWWICTDNIMQ